MSYCVQFIEAKFWISRVDFERGAEALALDSRTLESALAESGWEISRDRVGNIVDIEYVGEKLHADINQVLLDLAPFVRARSFILMRGEDDDLDDKPSTAWHFDGQRCRCSGFAVDDGYRKHLRQLGVHASDEEGEHADGEADDEAADDDELDFG